MDQPADAVRRRPKDRKQQILVQARGLFVELGYPNVSVNLIAQRVGITAGALYRHYANKAVLLEAVVRDAFDEVMPLGDGSVEEVLAAGSRAAVARPYLGALWSREVRHLPPDVRAEMRETMRTSTRAYLPVLAGHRPELKPHQLELLAWGVQSVFASPSYHSVRVAPAEHAAVMTAAAMALVGSELAPDRGPAPRATAGLAPASRRERLLLAAMRQFAERGYQDTSMADIGAVAEVTGQNLYGYFENKAAILEAVIERATSALWVDLDRSLAAHTMPRDALADVVGGYVRLARRWAGLGMQLTGEQELEERAHAYQREYVAEWVALVRGARPELTQTEGWLLVHMTLALIDSLSRTPHLVKQTAFDTNVTAMALGALGAPLI